MNLLIPPPAAAVLRRLEEAGFEACVVGGCVRDSFLGASPKDWDITTSALPWQAIQAFHGLNVIETGLQHGTVTVICDGVPVEVTTYRLDGDYTDGRHPDTVVFTASLREDLARRDFTVNAMAWQNGTLFDPFGGLKDLNNGILRCVGDPEKRFKEDALRILRALRFSCVLGFSIEPCTRQAIFSHSRLLKKISAERVYSEFCKLLCGKNAENILLDYHAVLAEWIPEIEPAVGFEQHSPYHTLDVWHHICRAVAFAPPEPVLRLATLFHDIGKPCCFTMDETGRGHFYGHQKLSADFTQKILLRLKAPGDTIKAVTDLVEHHDVSVTTEERLVKRWMNRLGEARFRQLLQVNEADAMAHEPEVARKRVELLREEQTILEKILKEGACFSLHDLAVDGNDLAVSGVPRGPRIGALLSFLLEAVIDGACVNERSALLKLAAKELIRTDE